MNQVSEHFAGYHFEIQGNLNSLRKREQGFYQVNKTQKDYLPDTMNKNQQVPKVITDDK